MLRSISKAAAVLLLSAAACVRSIRAACLPTAVSATKTVTVDGESLPLGVLMLDWDSAILAAEVFRILAEDVLGYSVAVGLGSTSMSAIWALAGCLPNEDCLHNASKQATTRRYHISLETWSWVLDPYKAWLTMKPETAPVRIPDIGYTGEETTFISSATMSVGSLAGVSLKAYTSYNASSQDPSQFFSRMQDVDTNMLAACSSDAIRKGLTDVGGFDRYVKAFPDDAGGYVADADGFYWPTCPGGYWWLSPACRQDPSKCIPWVTWKAWTATLHMQRATLYNMPLAIGFTTNRTAYGLMPRRYKVLMYWWRPDLSFIDLSMQMMVFPTDEDRTFGDTLADRRYIPHALDKWVMKGLQAKEPTQLAERFKIKAEDMDSMLLRLRSGKDARTVACEWLKGEDVMSKWKTWISRPTDCIEGQGLADDEGRPVSNVTVATRCKWCGLGYLSTYQHEAGGYVCEPCAAGKFFVVTGTGICRDCDIGRFSSTPGQIQCERCASGRYAGKRGSSQCTRCPAGFITEGIGETNSSGCVCGRGLYLAMGGDGAKHCLSCGWLHTAKLARASSSDDCIVDMEQVEMMGLLALAIGCSCAACLVVAFVRGFMGVQQDSGMQLVLKEGLRSISKPQYPMCLMPFICFCELSDAEVRACHEGARDRGSLLVLDTPQDIRCFQESGRKTLFFSYQWTSWQRRGPNASQLACMKAAAQRLRAEEGIDPEHLYVWLDILGIPQANDYSKALAVDSLYVYASKADYLVVICPEGLHEQTAEPLGINSYKSRIFCRVEQLAHFSCRGLGGMWVSTRVGELLPVCLNWLSDVVQIFEGDLTCCRLGHPGKRECDMKFLVPSVLAMYTQLLRRAIADIPDDVKRVWDLMNVDRNRTFPKQFSYNDSGKVRRRQLFGHTVDRIHDIVTNSHVSVGRKTLGHHHLRNSDVIRSLFNLSSNLLTIAVSVFSRKKSRQRSGYIAQWVMDEVNEANDAAHRQPRIDRSQSFATTTQLERSEDQTVLVQLPSELSAAAEEFLNEDMLGIQLGALSHVAMPPPPMLRPEGAEAAAAEAAPEVPQRPRQHQAVSMRCEHWCPRKPREPAACAAELDDLTKGIDLEPGVD
eukprot:TRINITY_DN49244_c0_g2_i1.p1 TRINITY_DN49244_c0_g2~~TRINITY_DN49244_c0_g2_i1.p1  ORF type:complete len:1102 (+),score=105.99 TRINITY_DN49244_c0_g2_i1:203-3508(+)